MNTWANRVAKADKKKVVNTWSNEFIQDQGKGILEEKLQSCFGSLNSLEKIDFKVLINILDSSYYKLIGKENVKKSRINKYLLKNKFRFETAKESCRKFRDKIEFESKNGLSEFDELWEEGIRLRTSAGIIVKCKKSILFVVDHNNVINFPMGKKELADSGLKSTSLREFAEETLYVWPINKSSDLNNYVECSFRIQFKSNNSWYDKNQRFYFYETQDKKLRNNIMKNFKKSVEVKELKWLTIEELSNYFLQTIKSSNFYHDNTIYQFAGSVQNFFTQNLEFRHYLIEKNTKKVKLADVLETDSDRPDSFYAFMIVISFLYYSYDKYLFDIYIDSLLNDPIE